MERLCNGTDSAETEVLGNLSLCHFVHQKSHTD